MERGSREGIKQEISSRLQWPTVKGGGVQQEVITKEGKDIIPGRLLPPKPHKPRINTFL